MVGGDRTPVSNSSDRHILQHCVFLASVCRNHATPPASRLTPDRRRSASGPVGFPSSVLALVTEVPQSHQQRMTSADAPSLWFQRAYRPCLIPRRQTSQDRGESAGTLPHLPTTGGTPMKQSRSTGRIPSRIPRYRRYVTSPEPVLLIPVPVPNLESLPVGFPYTVRLIHNREVTNNRFNIF